MMEIINTPHADIVSLWQSQQNFFATGKTRPLSFRLEQLKNFEAAILRYEKKIAEALWADLHKSYEEAYLTEINIVLTELRYHLKKLRGWMKPVKAKSTLTLFGSKSRILHEPLGGALIIAPWNYPFHLLMNPLVGAISSGCCAVLKPSPYAPNIALAMEELISETFPPHYVGIVQGNRDVNALLLKQRFDLFFFTGSPALGKVVMKAASEHLIPVVLELGGKSPCIVDKEADLDKAAKRIVWGKTVNAGQTCIAPDYLFVHASVKEELIGKMKQAIQGMFGEDIRSSRYYPRIVNDQAMQRLQKLMQHGEIRLGGQVDEGERYIAPTLIDGVQPGFPIMQEEIFGPLLPIMTFDRLDEVVTFVNEREKPLAFYYFGKSGKAKRVLAATTSGGACINDTLMHIANHHLPFGGVGNSGMGKYHGYESFKAFSNSRALVDSPLWMDMFVKYAPFKHFSLVKKFLG